MTRPWIPARVLEVEDMRLIADVTESGMRGLFGSVKERADDLAMLGYLRLVDGMRRTFEVTAAGRAAVKQYMSVPPAERA